MRQVSEQLLIRGTLAEVWDLYFKRERWPAWVDGFARVESVGEGYPETGATLVWESLPQGRGRVAERVLDHQPRRLHRIRYEDEYSEGELLTTFALEGEQVQVSQELSYEIREPRPFTWLTDLLFIRREMRRSLVRSLERLRAEVQSGTA
jgi:Polyketide cyclase / dehydrase and lipid transport